MWSIFDNCQLMHILDRAQSSSWHNAHEINNTFRQEMIYHRETNRLFCWPILMRFQLFFSIERVPLPFLDRFDSIRSRLFIIGNIIQQFTSIKNLFVFYTFVRISTVSWWVRNIRIRRSRRRRRRRENKLKSRIHDWVIFKWLSCFYSLFDNDWENDVERT
jgi:hypothetical protein